MESNTEKELKIKRSIRNIQRFLTVFLVFSLGYLALYRWDSWRQTKQNEELLKIAMKEARKVDLKVAEPPEEPANDAQKNDSRTSLSGYENLLKINPQIKGWIAIPGTRLSFPLLQGEDNDYYLNHDIYGQESRYGSIFVDYKADLYGGESNIIIYGHHMRDGNMFGSLKEYKNEAYYREHPSFFLFLPQEEREYEIIAVLNNNIDSGENEPFQYYNYERITDSGMFEEYYRYIKEYSIYDTGVTAENSDELITLCTCDYGSRDQRLLIVGRRIRL